MIGEIEAAGLGERLKSGSRSPLPSGVLDAAVVLKDSASAVVAVTTGVQGFLAILKLFRRKTARKSQLIVSVYDEGRSRIWTQDDGTLPDQVVDEVLDALLAVQERRLQK
jgi:hypothetical protein